MFRPNVPTALPIANKGGVSTPPNGATFSSRTIENAASGMRRSLPLKASNVFRLPTFGNGACVTSHLENCALILAPSGFQDFA
jgi:hypothetical protein